VVVPDECPIKLIFDGAGWSRWVKEMFSRLASPFSQFSLVVPERTGLVSLPLHVGSSTLGGDAITLIATAKGAIAEAQIKKRRIRDALGCMCLSSKPRCPGVAMPGYAAWPQLAIVQRPPPSAYLFLGLFWGG